MADCVLIYITAQDGEQGAKIARHLVERKLAACANVFPAVTSFFHWEGELSEAHECVVICKSVASLISRITEEVKSLHSYSCPCVIAVPVIGGNESFLSWIESQSSAKNS